VLLGVGVKTLWAFKTATKCEIARPVEGSTGILKSWILEGNVRRGAEKRRKASGKYGKSLKNKGDRDR